MIINNNDENNNSISNLNIVVTVIGMAWLVTACLPNGRVLWTNYLLKCLAQPIGIVQSLWAWNRLAFIPASLLACLAINVVATLIHTVFPMCVSSKVNLVLLGFAKCRSCYKPTLASSMAPALGE